MSKLPNNKNIKTLHDCAAINGIPCKSFHRYSFPHVTLDEFNSFIKSRFSNFEQNSCLRVGQHFCNSFNIHDQSLFYENDDEYSYEIILLFYIIL